MKEVHLICNAHLDPIWQWEWEEGAAAALSTFRSAADLADEFDYIFCHNEVTLYKYIEEYAPSLFARIKELIRIGKWRIMGGWYLQPDCNMPAGESIVRQILVGRQYFLEKFGQWSTTAINFDAFGHSKGLVQIIRKCGQDSVMLNRAGDDPIPSEQFLWEGLDGSRIKADATKDGYCSPLGESADLIRKKIAKREEDTICILWGVGNHGGGPSRKDLADIKQMIEESKDMEILHSDPDTFFTRIHPEAIHDQSLRISMPGCYTSMTQIKQKHAELENNLYMVEKLCSVASLRGLMEYPQAELDEVVEDLLNCEFHDVLPGTCVRAGEENGMQLLHHGLLILNRLRARAYFALSALEPKAKPDEYPVLVLNPNPYEWETEVVCEIMLPDINWPEDQESIATVYDENGQIVASQMVKEESNLNVDWRKSVAFMAKLKPMGLTRFSVYMEMKPKARKARAAKENVIVDLPGKYVEISAETGLMISYKIDGKEYIDATKGGAFCPVFYEDNPDPWGMQAFQLTRMADHPVDFALMKTPDGPFTGMEAVQVIEDGELYVGVECFFSCQDTRVRVEYDIYKKNPAVDIKVDVFMNDINRMLRLRVPTTLQGTYFGQTMFGNEDLYMNGRECVAQRFVAVKENEDQALALLNRGTYGSICEEGAFSMSLLRGVSYCAHPFDNRVILPKHQFVKKVDMGERNFAFRLVAAPIASLERLAAEFNMPPYACNVFPVDVSTQAPDFTLKIENTDIVLVTMKKAQECEGYILRLLNNDAKSRSTKVHCGGAEIALTFGRYEVKTLLYQNNQLIEQDRLMI